MRIISLEKITTKELKQVAAELKAGKVIAYPTETVYGLGCDATNQAAVERIYAMKQRDESKPLLFLVSSLKMAREYLLFSDQARRLAKEFWPGPLTLVLPVRPDKQAVIGLSRAGVRITSHPLALKLVRQLKGPLVSTSANPSGQPSAVSVEEVVGYFHDRSNEPDILLDGGSLPESLPSTVVDLTGPEPVVVREGAIRLDLAEK